MKTLKQRVRPWALRAFSPAAFAVIIAFGFTFTGCSDGNEETGSKDVAVTGVTLDEGTLDLKVDGTATLTATVAPKKATDKTVTWKSSDTAKATVTVNAATGVATVKGVAEGTADITVTAKNGKTATCVVTVSYADVTGVTLDQDDLLLGLGDEDQLTAAVLPKNADQTVNWSIAPAGFATVNNGKVTAVAVGKATITVTTTGKKANGQPETANCAVEVVTSVPVSGVTLDKRALELKVGRKPEELTATVSPRNAGNKNVTWSIAPAGFATVTVNTITGVATVTAVGEGTATITVTTQDGGKTATCEVTVTEAGVEGMVWIKAGTFTMGSPVGETDRAPEEIPHSVTLTRGFYMGEYQVTQELYEDVMKTNPSYHRVGGNREQYLNGITDTTNFPVERVNWFEALVFCNTLSLQKDLNPAYSISGETDPDKWGAVPTAANSANFAEWTAVIIVDGSNGYRLPTEAQWEYACRAETITAYNTGARISNTTGWYLDNSDDRTHAVGENPANVWGLYDMHGNVFEWCWAGWGPYESDAQTDPIGTVPDNYRIARGGSYVSNDDNLRSAARYGRMCFTRSDYIGFRLVLPVVE